MQIRKLRIASAYIDELRKFYVDQLGFEELAGIGGSDGLTIQTGFTEFTFVPGTEEARYHFAFNIRPDQLDDAFRFLESHRVHLLINKTDNSVFVDFPNWWARSIYFFDPAGNIVEFIARGALAKAGNAPAFSAASVIGVSEIGVSVDDVPAMSEWMSGVHGIGGFIRQQNTSEFAAIGDDEGLLLLVNPGRRWLMSDFEAGKHPVSMEMEQGGRAVNLTLYC
jgi:catechol 2,3-dioxygenase-like lactoylglutathione lyase family enzyme